MLPNSNNALVYSQNILCFRHESISNPEEHYPPVKTSIGNKLLSGMIV